MNDEKHMPGPWFPLSKNPRRIVTRTIPYAVVASCYHDKTKAPGTKGRTVDQETAKANARLIAAAPELLDALVGLLGCIMETRGPDSRAAERAARAAIAKATGEQPS